MRTGILFFAFALFSMSANFTYAADSEGGGTSPNNHCVEVVMPSGCANTSPTGTIVNACPEKPLDGSCSGGSCYSHCPPPPASDSKCKASTGLTCSVTESDDGLLPCGKGSAGVCQPTYSGNSCMCPPGLQADRVCGYKQQAAGDACPAPTPTPPGGGSGSNG